MGIKKIVIEEMSADKLEKAIAQAAKQAPIDLSFNFDCNYDGNSRALKYYYGFEPQKVWLECAFNGGWCGANKKVNFKCRRLKSGIHFDIIVAKNANKETLAEWEIGNVRLILRVKIIIQSRDDLNDPNAELEHKCTVWYRYWDKEYWEDRNKRVQNAVIKNNKFYDKDGEPINAINEKQVMAELFGEQ